MRIKPEMQKKALEEARELIFLTVFLTLFLNSLTIYRSLILNVNIFSFFHMGYNFLEAFILAKIIAIGKMFHLGEKYNHRSLIIPSVYMAAVFSVFVFIFSVIEHFFVGMIERKKIAILWSEFAGQGINEIIGKLIISFFVLILLFCFLQISRIYGEHKLFKLFFYRDKQ